MTEDLLHYGNVLAYSPNMALKLLVVTPVKLATHAHVGVKAFLYSRH